MYFCHACHGVIRAQRTGSHDLACTRCGQVGFVEEINRRGFSHTDDDLGFRTEARMGVAPFLLFQALVRGPRAAPPRNQALVTIIQDTADDLFLRYPGYDFIHPIITPTNFDNLVSLIMAQDGSTGPPPASESVRQNLPTEILTAASAAKFAECAICQEPYKAGDEVRRLSTDPVKCPHVFHDPCIQEWLKRHNTCPICRYQLRTDDPEYENRRQTVEASLQRSMSHRANSPNTNSHMPQDTRSAVNRPLQTPLSRTTTRERETMRSVPRLHQARPTPSVMHNSRAEPLGHRSNSSIPAEMPVLTGMHRAMQSWPASPDSERAGVASHPNSAPMAMSPLRTMQSREHDPARRTTSTSSVPPVEFMPREPQPYAVIREGEPCTTSDRQNGNLTRQPSRLREASQLFDDIWRRMTRF